MVAKSTNQPRRQLKSMVLSTKNGAQRRLGTINGDDADETLADREINNRSPSPVLSPVADVLRQKQAATVAESNVVIERPRLRRPSFLDHVLMRPHS